MEPTTPTPRKKRYSPPIHRAPHDEGEGNWLVSYADMMTLLVGFFVILLSFSTVDQKKMEAAQKSITQKFGGTVDRPYGEIYDRIKAALEKENLGNTFVIKENADGVEISFLGAVFFNSGSADVKNEGKDILSHIAPVILEQSKDYNILIEGHTDNVPVSGGGMIKNNWELSSLRACRVLDFFEQQGFSKKRLTAVGYAETRPEVPNENPDGSLNTENQAHNRRVVIKVSKSDSPVFGKEKSK
ncbi:MAG: flagellar motor protein MotB [Bdellovibrionaceae bacterium]|nr:flagellar motor protein MotB [Pseudobdellovibrionaceae bacterium]